MESSNIKCPFGPQAGTRPTHGGTGPNRPSRLGYGSVAVGGHNL
jgi:hypothetical protein